MSENSDTPFGDEATRESLPGLIEDATYFVNSRPLTPILNAVRTALVSIRVERMRENLDEFIASLTPLVVSALGSEDIDHQCPLCFERYIHTSDAETDHQCPVCGERYTHRTEPSLQPNINETPVRLLCGHIMGNECLKIWLRIAESCPLCRAQISSSLVNTNANNVGNDNDHSNEQDPFWFESKLSAIFYVATRFLATHPSDESFSAFRAWTLAQPSTNDGEGDLEVNHRRSHTSMLEWLETVLRNYHANFGALHTH